MSSLPILLDLHLINLKKCLFRAIEAVTPDVKEHQKKSDEGGYDDSEEMEAALDFPIIFQEFASKGVLYEINAIFESELYNIAYEVWICSEKHNGPKSILELAELEITDLKKLKSINDLRFGEVKKLAERNISCNLEDIDCWDHMMKIREIVNSLKHRQGFKDYRKSESTRLRIEAHDINVDIAKQSIDNLRCFLSALFKQRNLNVRSP